MNEVQQTVLDLVKARIEIAKGPEHGRKRELIVKYGEQELLDPLGLPEPERMDDILVGLAYHIAPVWDDAHQGVYVPLINKTLLAHNLGEGLVSWDRGQQLAADAGASQPSIDELRVLYLQKEAINAILKEHGGDILDGWIWSSTEDDGSWAWTLNFGSGGTYYYGKCYLYVSRAIVAFN